VICKKSITYYINRLFIRIQSKNLVCYTFFWQKSCQMFHKKSGLQRIFTMIFFYKIFFEIIPWCIWFQDSYSVYQSIGGVNDSKYNTQWSQRHNLFQTIMKKVPNNKPFVKSSLVGYKSHQNSLWKTTYVNSRNMNIIITRLVSIDGARCCNDTADL